jgi:hypothetical protein
MNAPNTAGTERRGRRAAPRASISRSVASVFLNPHPPQRHATRTRAVGQFLAQKSPAGENIEWKKTIHGFNHF